MMTFPTPEELAKEAREALRRRPPRSPRDLWTWLIRKGFINAKGQVTKLIGGSAEPEPNYQTWTPDDTVGPPKGSLEWAEWVKKRSWG
jgi:hypothetical protein